MSATFVSSVVGTRAPCFGTGGTDLGIPFDAGNGRVGLVLGDSFAGLPVPGEDWRSPCIVWSNMTAGRINVYGAVGGTRARELVGNQHGGTIPGTNMVEFTVIPNDVFAVGDSLYMSVMSVKVWQDGPLAIGGGWRTNFAMLYRSDNGGQSWVPTRARWDNNNDFADVWQMQTWVVHGGYAYLFGTSNGRLRYDGLFLARVPVDRIEDRAAYEYWGVQRPPWWAPWRASAWGWGRAVDPILSGMFGEPSVRIVGGAWVLCAGRTDYAGAICTWTAPAPNAPWAAPRVQVEPGALPNGYGGFIHPASTLSELHLMVSQWTADIYEVQHWKGAA